MESKRACSRCRALSTDPYHALFALEQPQRPLRCFILHPTYLDLSRSASNGCQICKLFAKVLVESAKAKGTVVDLFTSSLPVSILGLSIIELSVRELRKL